MNSRSASVRSVALACAAVCVLALLLCQPVRGLQLPERRASLVASAGVYSADQATRGQIVYVAQCAQCHGEPLAGTEFGPALIGNTFATRSAGDVTRDCVIGFGLRAGAPFVKSKTVGHFNQHVAATDVVPGNFGVVRRSGQGYKHACAKHHPR